MLSKKEQPESRYPQKQAPKHFFGLSVDTAESELFFFYVIMRGIYRVGSVNVLDDLYRNALHVEVEGMDIAIL